MYVLQIYPCISLWVYFHEFLQHLDYLVLRVHQNADVNHSHPLNHTTKCSVRCYSQIDEDNLNKKECLESSESFLSALKSSQREACNIAFHFGFNDGKDCELIDDTGYIMEKLLQNFYNNKVNNDANTTEMTKDVAGNTSFVNITQDKIAVSRFQNHFSNLHYILDV